MLHLCRYAKCWATNVYGQSWWGYASNLTQVTDLITEASIVEEIQRSLQIWLTLLEKRLPTVKICEKRKAGSDILGQMDSESLEEALKALKRLKK